ncbi:ABC transporter substrate-binding protein [Ideonella livida]|uniref:ABC transporter substrate-binding protein n=1 Tax=Ideonella livida TaxID=2707176 RepID=A0A7C9PII9_9BURK|nr:ABC transporter substrate-binding protein [Ideonella livida]NDY92091.1 ABC transporter substrate-binding protein [Ideonella livida]
MSMPRRRGGAEVCRGVLAWLLATGTVAATAQQGAGMPWLLGQSLPLSGPGYATAKRVQAGAQAWLARLNAQGGVQGRPVELLTLDDGGDPQRTAANVRRLARDGALAVLNCQGERACGAAAQATREVGLPLLGPYSGALALRQGDGAQVLPLRADDGREIDALLHQLQGMAVRQVALLGDGSEPARERLLAERLGHAALLAVHWSLPQADATALVQVQQALQARQGAGQAPLQALVLCLGWDSLDLLDRERFGLAPGVPAVVTSLSTAGLTQLLAVFRNQMVGFTSVLPNPDISRLPLVLDLQRDAEAYVGPEALNLDGLAAYLHLRVATEALARMPRSGPAAGAPAQAFWQALQGLAGTTVGGWRLNFGPGTPGASGVEIVLRGRDGRLRR